MILVLIPGSIMSTFKEHAVFRCFASQF